MTGAQAAAVLDRALIPGERPRSPAGPSAPPPRSTRPAASELTLLAVHAGFLLVGGGETLHVVDLHAARRLLSWDAMTEASEDAPRSSRRLLLPALLDLPPADARALEALGPVLSPLGVELSAFGADTVALHSLAPELDAARASELLAALRDLCRDGPRDPAARRREAALLVSDFVLDGATTAPREELLELVRRLQARRGPVPSGLAPAMTALAPDGLRRLLRRGGP